MKKLFLYLRLFRDSGGLCNMGAKKNSALSGMERFSGTKIFQPKVGLSNQNPCMFVSVRQTNQIALFLFVCCFCCLRVFISRSYKNHSITFKCLLCRLHQGSPVIFNFIILCLPAYLILLPCSCSYI